MKPTTRPNHLEILFEDQHLVVIEKPYGMLSTPFPGSRGKSAQELLVDRYRSRGKRTIFAVHRLDRDTSGVMMFALSEKLGKRIMDDWDDSFRNAPTDVFASGNPDPHRFPIPRNLTMLSSTINSGLAIFPKNMFAAGKTKPFLRPVEYGFSDAVRNQTWLKLN